MSFQSAGGIASAQSELQKYGSRSDILQEGTRQASKFRRRCIDYDSGRGRQRIRPELMSFQSARGIASAQSGLQKYGSRATDLRRVPGSHRSSGCSVLIGISPGETGKMGERVGFQSAGGIASAQPELQMYGSRSDMLQESTGQPSKFRRCCIDDDIGRGRQGTWP